MAKGVVNSVADVAKSLNGSPKLKSKNGVLGKVVTGLVPYDKDSSSDEEPVLKASVQKPSFVPRAVTIKNLPKPVSATNGKWTVTDIDHHNPSVHSDNSTGSTSNSWKITPQRPQSAMSSEDVSTNKWTVTPLRKAIGNVQLFVNLIFILYARWRFKIVCLTTKFASLVIRKKT